MKLIGRIVCLFKGHRRGRLVGEQRHPSSALTIKVFACVRCGRETRYKVKDQNHGTPGDES
jgi:hypothetical protein